MSVLLIDAGNSRIKLGWRRDAAYPDASAPREPQQAAFQYDELPAELPHWLRSSVLQPRRALGTNVAGPRVERLLAELLAPADCAVAWVRPGRELLGVVNGYQNPARLGADRWMGLVGVWNNWRRRAPPGAHAPVHVLAHFGTATTVDTLDPTGRFAGGLILPGRDLMRRSLAQGTAALPEAEGRVRPFPDNTHDAIASGVAAAQAGAVVRQWLAARERYRQEPLLVTSGGAWAAIQDEVAQLMSAAGATRAAQAIDNPVLDGLAWLAASGYGAPPSS